MSSSNNNLLQHPTLGCKLRGKASGTTTQYRGLKYASIPGRWKESTPVDSMTPDGNGVFDATRFGPSCPHKRGAQAWDLTLLGNTVDLDVEEGQGGSEKMDEFECLHVTITTPQVRKGAQKPLPVFVWIHGGGLSVGSTSWPQYDLRRFVERSVESGNPVIGVSINYRVGILGFLASRELGVEGNLGFKDQVLGFQWIKRHISGFGGDAANVTAGGESAGGISLSTVLCADTGPGALFERVVIMSGEATLRKPRNRTWHEESYADQLKFLGLEKMGGEDRVRFLQESDAEELVQKLPLAQHFCGCVDGKWLRSDVTLSVLADGQNEAHKPSWCKEFVVGDTAHDGTVLKNRILDDPRALPRFQTLYPSLLSQSESRSLLTAYHLASPSSPEQQKHGLLLLASELRFHLPTLVIHRGWRASSPKHAKHASRYHFHVANPLEGEFKGLASHELDVAFLLQNVNDFFPPRSRDVARQMADHFIGFVNGKGWAREGEVVVFGDEGVEMVREDVYDAEFRDGRGKILEGIGKEKLWRLAEGWQGVRAESEEGVSLRLRL